MGLQLSSGVMDGLTRFFNAEIGGTFINGITYAVTFKTESSKNTEYLELKQKLKEEGFHGSDILRVYEICNGYIFDMDVRMCQKIAIDLLRGDPQAGNKVSQKEILMLKDMPQERLVNDMKKLADKCITTLNKGQTELDVGLFSKNSTNRIQFNATLKDSGKPVLFTYSAYCLRHTDLERFNGEFLIPKGARISKIQPCEVFPTRTGVKFKLWLEKLDPRMRITR